MNLPVPVVGVDPGPDWAQNIVLCLMGLTGGGGIDGHNHTPGNGTQIVLSSLGVNSAFSMQNYGLNLVGYLNLTPQISAIATLTSLFAVGNELFYNDGAGNHVQITSSGSVAGSAGTITGLPSGTASASYLSGSGTFQFQSATNTPANITAAAISIAQQTASPNSITLQSPNSLAGAYQLILPNTLPASTSFLTLTSGGVLSGSIATANGITASNIANNTITASQIANNTITATQIANAAITTTQISASAGILGTQIASATIATANIANGAVTVVKTTPNLLLSSSSTGSFSTGSATLVDVTNATLNTFPVLSSNGVQLLLIPVNALTSPASVEIVNGSGSPSNINATIAFLRNGTVLCEFTLAGAIVAGGSLVIPPGCCNYLDLAVTPGNYVYKVQASVTGTGGAVFVNNVILAGREIT